jgi:hypothetical protein
MARDETFKRYEEAGVAFVESAWARATGLLRGLSDLGGSAPGPVEDLVGAGRERRDHLLELIRAEVRAQLAHLGLVTKEDLVALEERLKPSSDRAPAAKKAPAKKASAKEAPAKKATAKKAPAKRAAAVETATGEGAATGAAGGGTSSPGASSPGASPAGAPDGGTPTPGASDNGAGSS